MIGPTSNVTRIQDGSEGELLRLLVNSVTEYAVYMLDRDGRVATWTPGAQRIFGYSRDEIVGQHFSCFFSLEDQAEGLPEDVLQTVAVNGSRHTEGWRVRKDGSRVWAVAEFHRMVAPAGDLIGFALVTRDGTAQLAAQQALIESERRFRLLVEGVVDYAIYMLDASGNIANWNAGAERMMGYTAGEIVGHHFAKLHTPEDRAAGSPARILEAARTQGRYEDEGWRARKGGGRFWASVVVDAIRNEKGELIGFAKITRDITERQQAQEALRDSERRLRLLIDGVTDYSLYMLDPNGIVTSWNSGAERIKGYKANEIVGHHFSRFYTEQDRAAGLPAKALYIATTEGRFEADNWRVRKDGTLFWANVVLQSIRGDNGTLIGFAKITRDMTERRNAQLALERAQAERAQAQKFEALGQLTSGVAHDFNNLLMIVSGHMAILSRLIGEDARGRRAVESIDIAWKRGQSLTRQLLSFARRQPLNPIVANIAERVSAAKTLLSATARNPVDITDAIPADIWPVKVDINELELALVNLGLNARDAISGDGRVTISAQNLRLAGSETPESLTGDFVALSVTDTGEGIPADILPRIFEPFFTTKPAQKGTGLGLSQVYGFARQSGGTVIAQSALGAGTTVTIYLPRVADERAPEAGERERADVGPAWAVLLVEDNPEVAEATGTLLSELGYDLTKCSNSESALALLAEKRFDLLISDIVMPGRMNGLNLAREVKRLYPGLPVILVTGYSEVAEEAAREFVLLRKPYALPQLARSAAALIAKAHGERAENVVDLHTIRIQKKTD